MTTTRQGSGSETREEITKRHEALMMLLTKLGIDEGDAIESLTLADVLRIYTLICLQCVRVQGDRTVKRLLDDAIRL